MILEPLWLGAARKEIGVREVAGPGDNPTIAGYWSDAEIGDVAMGQDEVPWCAAFVGAMLRRGLVVPSLKANARSYEAWGLPVRSPCLGAVVVLSRPPHAWQGHVGLYLGTDRVARRVQLLGGNQGDKVSIAEFSVDRVVAYRWPREVLINPAWVGPFAPAAGAPIEPSAA